MHEYGILNEGGSGTGGHFNPLNAQHGCYRADMPSDVARKVGDLGNVEHGEYLSAENSLIKLDGSEQSVLGRSVVLHLNEDNCEPFEGPELILAAVSLRPLSLFFPCHQVSLEIQVQDRG